MYVLGDENEKLNLGSIK